MELTASYREKGKTLRLRKAEELSQASTNNILHVFIMHGVFQKLAQCVPLSGYEENTQRAWSVTLLAPDA